MHVIIIIIITIFLKSSFSPWRRGVRGILFEILKKEKNKSIPRFQTRKAAFLKIYVFTESWKGVKLKTEIDKRFGTFPEGFW